MVKVTAKERRVLKALQNGIELRWADMPHSIGIATLTALTEKGLIEQVPNGRQALSKDALWRLTAAVGRTPPVHLSVKESAAIQTSLKEQKVLAALEGGKVLRWCDMPNSVGNRVLIAMAKKGLIELVPEGAPRYAKEGRWRLKGRGTT